MAIQCKLLFFTVGCIFVSPLVTLSQNQIKGTIRDSSGRFVSSALVSIIRIKTEAGIDFTRSDENGNYRFMLSDSLFVSAIAIRVNAIGFLKAVKAIPAPNSVIDFIQIGRAHV